MKKNGGVKVKLALACLVTLSLLVITAIPAYAQPAVTVSVIPSNVSLPQGTSTTISIMITNDTAQSVSSALINLTYDSSVVEVISAGDSDFDVFIPNIVDGKVRMIGFQMGASLTTPIKFANVTIKAIGNPGDYTELTLEDEVFMGTGSPYLCELIGGSVTIPPVPVPVYNIYGLSVLIGLLAIISVISIRVKTKRR